MSHPRDYVFECFEQLDSKKLHQLRSYAKRRMRHVRVYLRHVDGTDLFSEALLRTADGRKTWREPEVDLAWHLYQAMRSIADEWKRASYERNFELPQHPTAAQAKPAPQEERNIDARRFAHELMRWFEVHDPDAVKVLNLLRDDYKPREIQQELGLSTKDYDRIRKQIFRHARARASRKGLY